MKRKKTRWNVAIAFKDRGIEAENTIPLRANRATDAVQEGFGKLREFLRSNREFQVGYAVISAEGVPAAEEVPDFRLIRLGRKLLRARKAMNCFRPEAEYRPRPVDDY